MRRAVWPEGGTDSMQMGVPKRWKESSSPDPHLHFKKKRGLLFKATSQCIQGRYKKKRRGKREGRYKV